MGDYPRVWGKNVGDAGLQSILGRVHTIVRYFAVGYFHKDELTHPPVPVHVTATSHFSIFLAKINDATPMTKFEWGMVSILSGIAQLRDFGQDRQ